MNERTCGPDPASANVMAMNPCHSTLSVAKGDNGSLRLAGLFYGRYWAQTSDDPQLVDSGQAVGPVRPSSAKANGWVKSSNRANGRANAKEHESLPLLPRWLVWRN